MKKLRILFFVMFGILMLGTVSCSSNNKSTQEQGVKVGILKDSNAKKITITYIDGNQDVIASAILQYNLKYKDVKVEGTCIPFDSYKDYKIKLATEILTGEGPDLLYFYMDYFDSLHKVMESGALCDLNQLISRDSEFHLADYNERVMDYGVLGGRRYFIPLTYSPRVFMTSKKVLEKNNVVIDESGWTWEELLKTVKKFMTANKDKDRYFFDSTFDFNTILGSYPKSFYDYKTKHSLFDCEEFRQLLRIYKEIFPAINTEEMYNKYKDNITEAVSKNDVMLLTESYLTPGLLANNNAQFVKSSGEEIEYIPFPYPYKSGKFVPSFYSMISINAKCKEKTAAFNFIKILLSKEIQSTSTKYSQIVSGGFIGTPINYEVMKDDLLFCTSQNNISPPISEKLKSQFLDMTQNIEKGELIDSRIYQIVNDAVKKYVNNTGTEDQTTKEIDNKVELFLNE